MLKITRQRVAGVVVFELAGRLAGPWVAELERCWRSVGTSQSSPVHVDLSSVTFIDDAGKELLRNLYRGGVKLSATGCLNTCIVDGITASQEKKG